MKMIRRDLNLTGKMLNSHINRNKNNRIFFDTYGLARNRAGIAAVAGLNSLIHLQPFILPTLFRSISIACCFFLNKQLLRDGTLKVTLNNPNAIHRWPPNESWLSNNIAGMEIKVFI